MNYRSHTTFLNNLPEEPLRKILLKILFVISLGALASFASVVGVLMLLSPLEHKTIGSPLVYIAQLVPFLILIFIFFYKGKVKHQFFLLFKSNANRSPLIIGFLLVLFFLITFIFSFLTFKYNVSPESWNEIKNYFIESKKQSFSFEYLIEFIVSGTILLFVSFAEEFIFRFTVFRFIRKKGLVLALLISSLLFAFGHTGSERFMSSFLLGVFFALYYEKTNYFFGLVLIHTVQNLFIAYYASYFAYLLLK